MELGLDMLIATVAFSALVSYWVTELLRKA